MRVPRASILLCGVLLAGTLPAMAPGTASAASSTAVVPCSRGLVALTFDDGPDSVLTPSFLTFLRERRVPATFFVVGSRVRANPGVVRRASEQGFVVGNHTYGHESLPSLSSAGVKQTLLRTRGAIRDAGAKPAPIMRPPYGAVDGRVRGLAADLGMATVMWTIDPRDWSGRSAAVIASSTLAGLRPGGANIVVLHDGVGNSRNTLLALPRIIRGARERGYCLAALDARGRPAPPVPRSRISDASATERPGGTSMRAVVTLDRPTSRRTSVRVRTVQGTATAGEDYVHLDRRVHFPVGSRRQVVDVQVRDDLRDEPAERLTLRLSHPRGMRIAHARGLGTIYDNDPPPRVNVQDVEVVEPTATDTAEVAVGLRLARRSERWVSFTVTTRPGTAGEGDFVPLTRRITLAPGELGARFVVTVLADDVDEGVETFEVVVTDGQNVDTTGAVGVVTIHPPPQ
jgi:peptidoglycan-N-acetylglucosamine deacetylase